MPNPYFPISPLIFLAYTNKEFSRRGQDDEDPEKRGSKLSSPYKWLSNFHHDLLAGVVMGGVVHTIVGPIEGTKPLLKTQDSSLAIVGSGRRKSKGMLDCIVRIVQEEGLLSLWGGNGSGVLRYYPSVALSFSLKVPLLHKYRWSDITVEAESSKISNEIESLTDPCVEDSNRLESDLEELNCSLDLVASPLGQGKAIEDPHADCYKDGEDQSDMVKIHEDQKFEVLILNTFV
ncbi:hypothetical protein Patl1_19214 [Pistacia atlantica]|uniref:Uncharacterized protein n=1 Tax=Pistacia atlantica TaxID=434234 RepID=A0ACC1BYF5_9ROSI|nr:hypothetical protein Patl1_19214 [Pistacia atlantica]